MALLLSGATRPTTARTLPRSSQQSQQQFASVLAGAMAAAMPAAMGNIATASQQYTVDLSGGQIVSTYKIPNTINWTATSAAGTGATNVTMYIFNEDVYNSSPTTNGSNAGSVTKSYGDGFGGKQYNNLLKFPGDTVGKGILVYGFNIIYTNASSAVQDPNGLTNAQFTWNVLNGYGKFIPETIDLTPGVNPGNYQDGLLRVKYPVYLNDIGQMSLNLPAGDTVSVTFFTTPMQ